MLSKSKPSTKRLSLIFLYLFFAVVGRLIPHPANVTPFTNICLWSGQKLSRWVAFFTIVTGLVISDALLAVVYHYPIFGLWTVFTYSGFLAIVLLSSKIELRQLRSLFLFLFTSSLGFWLWTNFGCWLYTPVYPKTWQGLSVCYTMALPFLRNQLIGDLVWFCVIALLNASSFKRMLCCLHYTRSSSMLK
jgi:hypothetical protein